MSGIHYDHLKFFNNSESNASSRLSTGIRMGGVDVVPTLRGVGSSEPAASLSDSKQSTTEKHASIVDYLKGLSPGSKASAVDIGRELNIDIGADIALLNILKNNPKIEVSKDRDGGLLFLYRAKFVIIDRDDFLFTLERNPSGILMEDIKDCYPAIQEDIQNMIIGGEVIAIRNKELKSLVVYPRGTPFYVGLSGTVKALPGEQTIHTSLPLESEIRRGESIKVGDFWYRVSSSTRGPGGSGSRPTSVLLDRDIAVKGDYSLVFDQHNLPLDGDYEGEEFSGTAVRHGCTTDLQALWHNTVHQVKRLGNNEENLAKELVSLNLISNQFYHRPVHAKRVLEDKNEKKKRARKLRESQIHSGGFGSNSHLRGTAMERILQETREKAHRDEYGR